jgi:hypothetical protein
MISKNLLIDCFVVAWKVLHATASSGSHGWQICTTLVVVLLSLEISVAWIVFKY